MDRTAPEGTADESSQESYESVILLSERRFSIKDMAGINKNNESKRSESKKTGTNDG
jgi:hypothetical protein